jgi:hypothetical protein
VEYRAVDTECKRVVLDGPIFDAWRVPVLERRQFEALGAAALGPEQLRYLARFAVLAPTTHNTVPQRLRLDPAGQAIDVFVSPEHVLPESDNKGRQALVSVGCAIANLELAAQALGVRSNVTVHQLPADALQAGASSPAPLHVARVEFALEQAAPNEPWLELMLEHRVVRAEYDRAQQLPQPLLATLPQLVRATDPALQLHVLDQSLVLRALGKFQEQADRYVLENRRFAGELGEWLLPNDDRNNPRAMRGYEFGFDDAFASLVHEGLLGSGALLPDQVAAFAKGGRVGLESSSAVFILSTAKDTTAERVAAGRAGQRLGLVLQREGYCSAFHAALTEVEWVSKMFAATVLKTMRRPMLVLRVGKVKRAADLRRPQAARPSLDQILL